MQLDRVTITGADDSVDHKQLLEIQERYPFVEWGILISADGWGKPRYPSASWFAYAGVLGATGHLNLSLHLCGRWVRDMLIGKTTLPYNYCDGFPRIQINFHAERCLIDPERFVDALKYYGDYIIKPSRQFIFQIDGHGGNRHMEEMIQAQGDIEIDYAALFDVSGGAGITPRTWPRPLWGKGSWKQASGFIYHGYAGGLGPHNIAEQLPKIAEAAGDCRIWIDMETHVRTPDDSRLDLGKVVQVLEFCKPWIAS